MSGHPSLASADDVEDIYRVVILFAFAVLLYNCWLLVDLLVRDVETVIDYKPEVTAKRVLAAMTQYLRPVT